MKKVLVIGSGGREHALAWKIAQSSQIEAVYVAPGNAGTAREAKCHNVNITAENISELLAFVHTQAIDLTVVGPEQPLVAGVVDEFQKAGMRIFGPSQAAAQLEGSKSFTKDFLKRHNIPTAAYETFSDIQAAEVYIRTQGAPIVVKADGLAAGKGVLVAETTDEAIAFAKDCLSGNAFGSAGAKVVVEEFMEGEEASFICISDGAHVLPMATSQDHKRVGDGDSGPNTGGMGAYSPAPVVTEGVFTRIMDCIITPTIKGLAADGMPFVGFLYAGLMIDKEGNPRVVEYNVRFGDPETQPVLMRLQSDFVSLIDAALDGTLGDVTAEWDNRAALGVVMAAGGYPGNYEKGKVISGLEHADSEVVKVFHAGTTEKDGQVVTSGGRVLCVTALGDDIKAAQTTAYKTVSKISWDDEQHRSDIGWRAVKRG